MVMVASEVTSAAMGSAVHKCMSVVAVGIAQWRRPKLQCSIGTRDGLHLRTLMPTVTVVTNVDLEKEEAVKLVGSITECIYPIVGCPAGYVHVHGACFE